MKAEIEITKDGLEDKVEEIVQEVVLFMITQNWKRYKYNSSDEKIHITVINLCNGILFSNKRIGNTHHNMNDSEMHYAK